LYTSRLLLDLLVLVWRMLAGFTTSMGATPLPVAALPHHTQTNDSQVIQ
jgi:hypothetical protein